MTTRTTTMPVDIEQDNYPGLLQNMEYALGAFYKIRSALAATQAIDKTVIKPDSKLETFFPRQDLRKNIKSFQEALGVDVDLLVMKDSLEWAIIISAAASLISLFFSWKIAIACLVLTVIVGALAGRFGRELRFASVQQLTEKIAREHYATVQWNAPTENKKEMNDLLKQLFVDDFDMRPIVLTNEAPRRIRAAALA